MFLIPIGHEETSVRRLPWVTFAVMGLCLLSLLAFRGAGTEETNERFGEAVQYFLQHPYLELRSDFRELIDGNDAESELSIMIEAMDSFGRPPSPEEAEQQQARLDSLIDSAMSALESHPFRRFGLIPAKLGVVSLLTHMFMHAGWLHLLGNLFMLYLAGPYIEDVWGRPLYTGFYLISGVAAALAFVAQSPASQIPLVGASGAIAGVMGAFLVRYGKTKIRFFYIFGFFVRGTFNAPAWLMLPLWLVGQLFMAAMTEGMQQGGGVAYWAHIGGFVFGASIAAIIRWQDVESRFIESSIQQKITTTVSCSGAVEAALAAHENGDTQQALETLAREASKQPPDREAVQAYWTLAIEGQRAADVAPAMLALIQHELRNSERDVALGLWDELVQHVPEATVGPALCVRLAEAMGKSRAPQEIAMLLRRAMLGAGRTINPSLALRVARLGREHEPQVALAALNYASQRDDIDPGMRAEMDKILEQLKPTPVS
ncbi:MAG: rhomboid family intramembrane serine protease [bacterium]|nr:rhomboid family intramembrane serine protease [bacterium]